MNKLIYPFIVAFVFISQTQLYAQKGVHKKTIHIKALTTVNFRQLAEYERAHPVKRKQGAIEQGEDREKQIKFKHKPAPKNARTFNIKSPVRASARAATVQSPAPSLVFNGILDNGSLYPPDIEGAAGPVYVMETTNQEFDLYTKDGTFNSSVSPYTLFASTGGSFFFDPHVLYDETHGHYLIVVGITLANGDWGVCLAVSETSDPTGSWYIYAYDGSGSPHDLFDFPLIGYNSNWIVVTGNDFINYDNGGNTVIGKIIAFNRASLYSGSVGTATEFSDPNSFSISPAQTHDASQLTEYLVEDYDGNEGTDTIGYMQIPTITGTPNAPVYSAGSVIGVNQTWSDYPVGVPQKGTSELLDDDDSRVGRLCIY